MILVIQGLTGSGKTTLRNSLLKEHLFLSKCLGYTTRSPRKGEVDGVDYKFISAEDFNKNPNLFLKKNIGEKKYGVSKQCMKNKILILDDNGAKELEDSNLDNIHYIYLKPPVEELIKRLKLRGDKEVEINKRIKDDLKSFSFCKRKSVLVISRGNIKEIVNKASCFIEQIASAEDLNNFKSKNREVFPRCNLN
ncbi:MAG: AAA family ATPase [Alphaproteobacteria bacterium]|nr:AAA family ATPase [Alphaproteobacteria bacterium]